MREPPGDDDWDAGFASSVGLFLNGDAITDRDRRGQRVTDDSFLLLFNAYHEPIDWTLPKQWGEWWELMLDTSGPGREGDACLRRRVGQRREVFRAQRAQVKRRRPGDQLDVLLGAAQLKRHLIGRKRAHDVEQQPRR